MAPVIRKRALSPHAVRTIREAKKIKLREVADHAGISVPYLSRIERGERDARLGTILAIADALGVHPDAISYPAAEAVA